MRHVPLFCDHEVHKSKRFVVGVRKEVKSILASVSHTQYGQVVEAAIRIERSLGFTPQIAQGSPGPKRDGSTWTQGGSIKKSKRGGKPPWVAGKTGQRQQSSQSSVKHRLELLRPQDINVVSMEGFIEGSADGVPMFVTDVESQDILQRNVHS